MHMIRELVLWREVITIPLLPPLLPSFPSLSSPFVLLVDNVSVNLLYCFIVFLFKNLKIQNLSCRGGKIWRESLKTRYISICYKFKYLKFDIKE